MKKKYIYSVKDFEKYKNRMKTSILVFQFMFILISSMPLQLMSQQRADCDNAFPICELRSYHFESLLGAGDIDEEVNDLSCTHMNFKETNSHWIKFKIQQKGTIVFSIDPEDDHHDIDFVLFESSGFEFKTLEEVRCMSSGENIGQSLKINTKCLGTTGLNMRSVDFFEKSGCKYNDDNYLKYLQAEAGEEYVLFVNNYQDKGSISITIDGTAVLEKLNDCPDINTEDVQILNVYPNPVNDELNIEIFNNTDIDGSVEVLDINSKVIMIKDVRLMDGISSHSIHVSDLPASSYILRLRQGKKISVKSFIKS